MFPFLSVDINLSYTLTTVWDVWPVGAVIKQLYEVDCQIASIQTLGILFFCVMKLMQSTLCDLCERNWQWCLAASFDAKNAFQGLEAMHSEVKECVI